MDSLANALLKYQGTVLFTSHDRHFMSRVATNIIEVRDGCARNYLGGYDSYLYSINQEIADGNRETATSQKAQVPSGKVPAGKATGNRDRQKEHRKRRKEIKVLERKIAQLDENKKMLNQQLLETTDADEALKLHSKFTDVSDQLSRTEDRWLQLTEEA